MGDVSYVLIGGRFLRCPVLGSAAGRRVCDYCLSDVRDMAQKVCLKSLNMYNTAVPQTLYWEPGMKQFAVRE